MIVQTSVCSPSLPPSIPPSPSQLDCVEKVQEVEGECPKRCEGTILNVERLSSSKRNEEGAAQFMADYETYKDHYGLNNYYVDSLTGQTWREKAILFH